MSRKYVSRAWCLRRSLRYQGEQEGGRADRGEQQEISVQNITSNVPRAKNWQRLPELMTL